MSERLGRSSYKEQYAFFYRYFFIITHQSKTGPRGHEVMWTITVILFNYSGITDDYTTEYHYKFKNILQYTRTLFDKIDTPLTKMTFLVTLRSLQEDSISYRVVVVVGTG